MCPDWQNDIEGKPESKDSKNMRGMVQIASMFAKGVAESGVLSDGDSMAVKALATIAQGQAEAQVHTNWKERAKLGGKYILKCTYFSYFRLSCFHFTVVDGLKGLKKEDTNTSETDISKQATNFPHKKVLLCITKKSCFIVTTFSMYYSADNLILWQKPEKEKSMYTDAYQTNMLPPSSQWNMPPIAAPQWLAASVAPGASPSAPQWPTVSGAPGAPPSAPQWPAVSGAPGAPPSVPQWPAVSGAPGAPPSAPQWPTASGAPGAPPSVPQWPTASGAPGAPPSVPQWPTASGAPGAPPSVPQWPAVSGAPGAPPSAPQWPAVSGAPGAPPSVSQGPAVSGK